MEIPDDFEVRRILEDIPVDSIRTADFAEYRERLMRVSREFDVFLIADDDGGFSFEGEGLQEEDQPLFAAISVLLARRLGNDRLI
jgi:hypothetical protein